MVAVISQPDRPRGRGRQPSPSPVARVAQREAATLLQPQSASDAGFLETLRGTAPDIGVVAAYGQFLPRSVRELPTCGYTINAHASLLPRYRGAEPIARALLAGESRSGISIMQLVREMDAGPVAFRRELAIGETENRLALTERLAILAAEAIDDALEAISEATITWSEQDASLATEAPKLDRAEAIIDWREDAPGLVRRIRALSPQPGATTELSGTKLRILEARALPAGPNPEDAIPGQVVRDAAALRVATGDGWLLPLRVQRAGGRALTIEEFLRGNDIPDGRILG